MSRLRSLGNALVWVLLLPCILLMIPIALACCIHNAAVGFLLWCSTGSRYGNWRERADAAWRRQ